MRYVTAAVAVLLLAAAAGCLFAGAEPENAPPGLPATIDAAVARAAAAQTAATPAPPTPTVAPPFPPFTPTPTPVPTPTPAAPKLRQLEGKRYMLELINAERAHAGLNPVALGDNIAAQLHAETALANCFASHWGLDGLKPYMRYSLAGGYQSNGENGHGRAYCLSASDGYAAAGSLNTRVDQAIAGWMNSAGHRRNLLGPWHKQVNIGIAYDRYNTVMYQHFAGDYVAYDRLPVISNGILSLSGTARNGVNFDTGGDLGIAIFYDPPPHELTRGQVARTYCYDNGRQIAALREPLTDGNRWPTHEFTATYQPCANPYDVPVDAPAPRSADEAEQVWQQAYYASQSQVSQAIAVPWITASEWTARGETFAVRADINKLLRQHGDGVYSVMVWGKIAGADVVISQYAIFHGATPPDTYYDN